MSKYGFVYGDEKGVQMYVGNSANAAVAKAMEVVTDPTALAAIEMLTGKKTQPKSQPQNCPCPCAPWNVPNPAPVEAPKPQPTLDSLILTCMKAAPNSAYRCKDFTDLPYSYATKSGRRNHPSVTAVAQAMKRLMSRGLVERNEVNGEVYTVEEVRPVHGRGYVVETVEHTSKVAVYSLTAKGRRG